MVVSEEGKVIEDIKEPENTPSPKAITPSGTV